MAGEQWINVAQLRYPRVMRRIRILFLCCFLAGGCSVGTPSHDIPVRSDYIEAGVQVGDTIKITMKDGEEITIVVVNVGLDYIEGPDGNITVSDIQKIVKRSWQPPGHPCGANEPVGCSVPDVILLVEKYKEQAEKFHPACVTHDFCYRHGNATYGESRENCDEDFLVAMKKSCGGMGGIGILDLEQYSICHTAAQQTYNAVRLKGEPAFRTTTSSVCEYKLSEQ
jgi:hypothetical protein